MNEFDRSFENIALFSTLINVLNYDRNTQQEVTQKVLTEKLDRMIEILEDIQERLDNG